MGGIKHLVISGAGPNGLLHLGAISEYVNRGMLVLDDLESTCGCSAGSIIAVLLALKVPVDSVSDYVIKRPWHKFLQVNLAEINSSGGIAPLSKITEGILPFFLAHDIPITITFEEVYQRTKVDLHIFSTSLKTFEAVDFNRKTHATMEVVHALALSSALPPLFGAGLYEDVLYVDGGFSNNFPIKQRIEDLGVDQAGSILALNCLVTPKREATVGMTTIELLNFILGQMIHRLCQGNDNHTTAIELCPHYVPIKCLSMFRQEVWGIFLSSEEAKLEMIQTGVLAAREKLDSIPPA